MAPATVRSTAVLIMYVHKKICTHGLSSGYMLGSFVKFFLLNEKNRIHGPRNESFSITLLEMVTT